MTTRERFNAIMNFEPCDRGLDWENGIWLTAVEKWKKQGMPPQDPSIQPDSINVTGRIYFSLFDSFFGLDETPQAIPVNYGFLPPFPYILYEETENYKIVQNEWGIKMQVAKSGDTMPHFLDRLVKTEKDFEALKERLQPRINERYPDNWDELLKEYENRTYPLFANDFPFGFYGITRELIGAMDILYAFYDDPKLIKNIMNFTADYLISIWEKALVEAKPDFFRIWEDMCFNTSSLISPEMFREFMLEPYKKLTNFIKDCGCKHIFVDTDGECSKLIPLFIEGGVTGLYPFECTAGMDVVEVRKNFPKLQMMGGIDKKILARGKKDIDDELNYKLSILGQGGFVAHCDHFVPPDSTWENFVYYRLKMKEILYKSPINL